MRPPLRRAVCAVATAALAAVVVAAPALADDIVNDIATPDDVISVTAGATATVTLSVVPRNGDGKNGCNLTGSTIASFDVGSSSSSTATVTPSSVTFTSCSDTPSVTVSGMSAGSATFTLAQTANTTNGTFNTAPATFTVTVTPAAGTNAPPSVEVTGFTDGDTFELGRDALPTPGCSATDSEDGTSTPTPTVADQRNQWGLGTVTVECSYTDQGNLTATSSASYTVADTTGPTGTLLSRTTANAAGWNNEAVTVTWTCDDGAGSGVVSATVSDTLTDEGAGQTATATCEDHAGNTSGVTLDNIDIDLTAPTVTWTGGPVDGASYHFGSVPAAPSCTATDTLSGPNGCAVTGYGTSVGSHTLTATGTDNADNTTQETRSYNVLAWTLLGFHQPVDMGGVWNTVKNGSTVPLKFEVFAGDTELTSTSVVSSFTAVPVSCNGGAALEDALEVTTTGGTSLRYDSTGGQFVQNWQTPRRAGSCYRVTLTTQDGSSRVALFKLR